MGRTELGASQSQVHNNNGSTSGDSHGYSDRKSSFPAKIVRIFVFGLLLYLVDVGLHLCIASHYLTMRQCHRSISHQIVNFKLDNFVNLSSFSATTAFANDDGEGGDEGDFLAEKINSLLHNGLYLTLRDKVIKILPTHWVQRIIEIVSFQISQHNFSQIPQLCTLNGQRFTSLPHMVSYVCKNAFSAGIMAATLSRNDTINVEEEIDSKKRAIYDALDHLIPDKETEDAIAQAILKKNMTQLMTIIFRDVLGNDNTADHELVQNVAHRFAQTFDKEEDVQNLSDLFSHDVILQNVGKLFEAIGSIDKEYLKISARAFAKIDPNNIPEIERLLGTLNLKLATFISDPSVIVQFFGDPAKGAVLLEVQKLLPQFDPADINAILTIKIQFDKAMPDGVGEKILGKILELPMNVLFKVFSLNLTPEEMAAVQRTLRKLLTSEATQALLEISARDLRLFSAEGRNMFLSNCTHSNLEINCLDNSTDLCPNGHLQYGLVTIGPVALPGILFAFSEFFHHKAFRFGGVPGKLIGQNWSFILRLLLLPMYILVMIPFMIVVTIYQYVATLKALMGEKRGFVRDLSGQKISEPRVSNQLRRWREEYNDAVQLHSLQAQAESFLQIIVQLFFMILLVLLGAGTVVAGVGSAQSFFDKVFPLTVASLFVSTLSLVCSAWRLQRGDFLAKDLFSFSQTLAERFKQATTFFLWFAVTKISQIFSVVTLSLLAWIELFSGDLTSEGFSLNIHILPFFILVLGVPVNIVLYMYYVKEESVFRFAHGALSAIFPSRYLHRSDRSKTKNFLGANQLTMWLAHLSAWMAYSAAIYVKHQEESGLLRILPVAAALVTMGPLLAAIHWTITIDPVYDTRQRSSSFLIPSASENDPEGEESTSNGGKAVLSRSKMIIFNIWQGFTITSRGISFALLCYVYYEHWEEVGGDSVRLAVLETVPYALLILLGNIGLQYIFFGGTLLSGLIAVFLPNQVHTFKEDVPIYEAGKEINVTGKRKLTAQKSTSTLASLISMKRSSTDDAKLGRYLLLNILLNAILHILLWVVLTFYCWECTKLLSLEKLTICFPVTIALWVTDLILTGITWRTAIKTGLDTTPDSFKGSPRTSSGCPKPWASKAYSVTTQL